VFLSHTSIDIIEVMASCGLNPDLLESQPLILCALKHGPCRLDRTLPKLVVISNPNQRLVLDNYELDLRSLLWGVTADVPDSSADRLLEPEWYDFPMQTAEKWNQKA
jgi:hypothetical protein